MRGLRGTAAFFLLVLAVFLWRMGCGLSAQMDPAGMTLRCTRPLSAADFERMTGTEARAEKPVPFALWTQMDYCTAANGARDTRAAAVLVLGDTSLLFPGALAETDSIGVLVDRATARALFGDENAEGMSMDCLGKTRIVRAVLDIPLPTVILRADPADSTPLQNVTILTGDGEAFAMRHGLNTGLALNKRIWSETAQIFCALPVLMAWGWALRKLAETAVYSRKYLARQCFWTLCMLALAVCGLLYLLALLPPQWIPPRWSEFEFWARTFEAFKTAALEVFSAQKYRPDLIMLAQTGRAVGWGLCSCAALAAARLWMPFRNG